MKYSKYIGQYKDIKYQKRTIKIKVVKIGFKGQILWT